MKTCAKKTILMALMALILPVFCYAQQMPGDSIYSLNTTLDKLFEEMMPLCKRMTDVGRAIAGFAALWYIAIRVWKHLAKAEAIDFYPLLRPFAIGMAILLFPQVISLMNGVLKPTVVATAEMSKDSRKAILWSIQKEAEANKKAPPVGDLPGSNGMDKYEQPDGTSDEGFFSGLKNAFSAFALESMFKIVMNELLRMLYTAAALCINTIRTFYLIVLVILGPLVLGLSVFDGFQHTLASWFARYINIYMWLPVANIFGAISAKIFENMMVLDQDVFSSLAYAIFMIISIIGYTTVPTVAGYIIQAGGNNTLLKKVGDMSKAAGQAVVKAMI